MKRRGRATPLSAHRVTIARMASIQILYTEPLGYTIALVEEFANMGHKVEMIYWDLKKLAPFIPVSEKVTLVPRSTLTTQQLRQRVIQFAPDLLLVSGWMDIGYLLASLRLRKSAAARIVLFDDQWMGTPRQRVGGLLASVGILSPFFTHAASSGPRQYEYARRFGFRTDQIILNWLSCDTSAFAPIKSKPNKRIGSKRRVLFVGRFSREKGIEVLAKAWRQFIADFPGWELHAVGAGPLESILRQTANVRVHPYAMSDDIRDLAASVDFAVVPSLRDQWGVVVHEMASLGLPLVTSDSVGSSDELLISGFNGFRFKSGDVESLRSAMEAVANLGSTELALFSQNSSVMARRFSTSIGAMSLLSVVSRNSDSL